MLQTELGADGPWCVLCSVLYPSYHATETRRTSIDPSLPMSRKPCHTMPYHAIPSPNHSIPSVATPGHAIPPSLTRPLAHSLLRNFHRLGRLTLSRTHSPNPHRSHSLHASQTSSCTRRTILHVSAAILWLYPLTPQQKPPTVLPSLSTHYPTISSTARCPVPCRAPHQNKVDAEPGGTACFFPSAIDYVDWASPPPSRTVACSICNPN